MGQITQLQREKDNIPYISKFLKLRVHHLSYFLINLWQMSGTPYGIEIKFNMENYVDTPSTKNTPRAVIFDNLSIQKHAGQQIIIYRKNGFNFKTSRTGCMSTNSHSDIRAFDSAFQAIEENIDKILEINKVIKKTKALKKKPNMIDKYQYRKILKDYEREKSEAKKRIREVIVRLYS